MKNLNSLDELKKIEIAKLEILKLKNNDSLTVQDRASIEIKINNIDIDIENKNSELISANNNITSLTNSIQDAQKQKFFEYKKSISDFEIEYEKFLDSKSKINTVYYTNNLIDLALKNPFLDTSTYNKFRIVNDLNSLNNE